MTKAVNVGAPLHLQKASASFGDRTQMDKQVEALLNKASEAKSADDAMKFAQAACNAANAMCSLASSKTIGQK